MVTRPLNCPNCGAPIDYSQRKCAYCGTFYDEFEFEEEPIEYEVKGGLGNQLLFYFGDKLIGGAKYHLTD